MNEEITKEVPLTITVNNGICSATCVFRSYYVDAFCKRYKCELEGMPLYVKGGNMHGFFHRRPIECIEEFGGYNKSRVGERTNSVKFNGNTRQKENKNEQKNNEMSSLQQNI